MRIELTEQQQQAIRQGEAVRVTVPEMDGDLVLLRADQYADLRESLEDEREKAAWAKLGRKAANRWAGANPF